MYVMRKAQCFILWDLAKDAGAVSHVNRIVLVNLDIIDEYLEAFRDEEF